MNANRTNLLTLNTGSSSLKTAVYRCADLPQRELSASVQGIGQPEGHLKVATTDGRVLVDDRGPQPDQQAALQSVLEALDAQEHLTSIAAVGHRVVHGGLRLQQPVRIDAGVIAELRRLVPLAPDHLPQSLAAIEAIESRLPDVPQFACFDTSFHRTLPPVARTLPLPRELTEQGVVRFGFHGLSYEYLVEQLRELDGPNYGGRAVLAHLGNGASMAAVLNGQSIDTSMGFTPAGGLVMSARSGDLDPGVLVYLARARGYDADRLNRLINQESGLAGVSGSSSSMQTLLSQRDQIPAAALAVDIFCYQARKFLGAYAAALGGLDTVVFAGGIGENSAAIREQICSELEFLGIRLDPERNNTHAPLISATGSSVNVRVIETDEDSMIARHTNRLLARQTAPQEE